MSIQGILASILSKLSGVNKWQRDFITEAFRVLFCRQGKATFENLARYSKYNELTFRRGFRKYFDWLGFNLHLIDWSGGEIIGVMDCSFIGKSGKNTYGLDKFWSGCLGKVVQGLEVSVVGCINLSRKQTFVLEASQTPADLSTQPEKHYSRVDFYMEQFMDCLPYLKSVTYWVADGFYAKEKVFSTFQKVGKHFITKLRSDAALYYLWEKPRKKGQRGPARKYAGKVDFSDLTTWQYVGQDKKYNYLQIYAQRLYSKHYQRSLQIVLVRNTKTNTYLLLASTHLAQDAQQIVEYYQLRFQLEFVFRDAKQFMGFTHSQARDQDKLDFHFNLSLSAVNLARHVLQEDKSYANSLNAFIRRQTNLHIAQLIYEQLSPNTSFDLIYANSLNLQFWPNKAA